MKWRLFRASISALVSGEHGIISRKPKLAFFDFDGHGDRIISYPRILANCQIHSSSSEDDDFSELGSPVSKGSSTVLKLMTEKPEPFRKTDPARKASSAVSLPAERSPTSKEISRKQGKSLSAHLHLKLESDNEVSRHNVNSKNASDCKNSSSITIENIPSAVNLSELEQAISIFGKISNASMRTVPKELDCCDVKFESIESSSRAVSVGGITVRSFHLPIRPLHVPGTVTIRISNIDRETTDSKIHSVCMECNPLEGLVRTKDDEVDVLFSVKNNSETLSILNKLNSKFIDDCQWSAFVLPKDSDTNTSKDQTNDEQARCNLRLQINSHLADLKKQLSMKRLYVEDLEILHLALVHLEGHQPATISKQSNTD